MPTPIEISIAKVRKRMGYAYKVVPFIGQSRGALSASSVAKQLEHTISEHARNGWEFFQLSDVNVEVQPGCISGLFGGTVQYIRFDQLIFRGDSNIVKPSIVESERSEDSEAELPLSPSKYQPAMLPSGKIKCWACGETNNPDQDKCWDCYSPLYEGP